MNGFVSLLQDKQFVAESEAKKRADSSGEHKTVPKHKKHKPLPDDNIERDSDSFIISILEKTVDVILTTGSIHEIPRALHYTQTIAKHVISNKKFVVDLYNKIESHFNKVVLPRLQDRLGLHRDKAVEIFNEEFTQWRKKLSLLRLVFLTLDNLNKVKIPLDTKGRLRTQRQLVPTGIFLFADSVINSKHSYAHQLNLFDTKESKMRNIIIANYVDLLQIFLSASKGTDTWEWVSVISQFHNNIYLLVDIQKPITETEKIHMPETTFLAINHLLKGPVFEKLLEEPLKFFTNTTELLKKLALLAKISNLGDHKRYSETAQAVVLYQKTDYLFPHVIKPLMENLEESDNAEELCIMVSLFENTTLSKEQGLPKIASIYREVWRDKTLKVINDDIESSTSSDYNRTKLLRDLYKLSKSIKTANELIFEHDFQFLDEGKKGILDAINSIPDEPARICDKLLKHFDQLIMRYSRLMDWFADGNPFDPEDDEGYPFTGETKADRRARLNTENFFNEIITMIPEQRTVFFAKYHIGCSRRVLRAHSLSIDLIDMIETESLLIETIQKVVGKSHVEKIYNMLEELKRAHSLSEDHFRSERDEWDFGDSTELEPMILLVDGNNWPKAPTDQPVRLRSDLAEEYEDFVDFADPNGQKEFKLINSFQRVTIDIDFADTGNSHVTIDANIYQTAILMSFEEAEVISFNMLLKNTCMTESYLRDNLVALTTGKHKLIIDNGDETYSLNKKFKSKKPIILAPVSTALEPSSVNSSDKKPSLRDKEEVLRSRLLCFIVRILKEERQIEHDLLIGKIVSYLNRNSLELLVAEGKGNTYIKELIETLINDAIIERSGGSYKYIP